MTHNCRWRGDVSRQTVVRSGGCQQTDGGEGGGQQTDGGEVGGGRGTVDRLLGTGIFSSRVSDSVTQAVKAKFSELRHGINGFFVISLLTMAWLGKPEVIVQQILPDRSITISF